MDELLEPVPFPATGYVPNNISMDEKLAQAKNDLAFTRVTRSEKPFVQRDTEE